MATALAPVSTALDRPTAASLDLIAQEYLTAKANAATATERVRAIEEELVQLVQTYGIVPPNAEKSRKLAGVLSEFTVTKADVLTINDDRVETLREALEANGHGEYFSKLFAQRTKYEIVDGAEAALKSESLPKRLAEKVINLWGRCISVKPKKPSLKVVIADPAKPAKKSRAKKGGAQ